MSGPLPDLGTSQAPVTHPVDEIPSTSNEPFEEKREGEEHASTVIKDGATVTPAGIPMPSIQGDVVANPTVPVIDTTTPPTLSAGRSPYQQASGSHAPSAAVSEKTLRPPTTTASSSSETLDGKPKKPRLPFGKARKAKAEESKKAKEKEAEADAIKPIGFFRLFRFALPHEVALDFIGALLAAAAGAAQPLMTLIFGRLTTSFTQFGTEVTQIAQQGLTPESEATLTALKQQLKIDSGHNALYLMAIGLGIFVTTSTYMFIFNLTGELNAKRIREKYLRAVLRQEVRADLQSTAWSNC